MWELVRFYHSLGRDAAGKKRFVELLRTDKEVLIGTVALNVERETATLLADFLEFRATIGGAAADLLRTEEEAVRFCQKAFGETPKFTQTQNEDHHQSSKAMVLTTTRLAESVCKKFGVGVDPNPQTRCVWVGARRLHVTARNLDGAIPGLINPAVVWEIKEYWGKTKGGSKMSDAVYECALVGREIRDLEKRSDLHIEHAVFLDGKEQWASRRSDLLRFCDLFYQGIIDQLFIGREVETDWKPYLIKKLESLKSPPK